MRDSDCNAAAVIRDFFGRRDVKYDEDRKKTTR